MEIDRKLQERWLDTAWGHLYGDGSALASPARIRRDGLDRALIRQAELAAIAGAERELDALREGRLRAGQGRGAVAVGDIRHRGEQATAPSGFGRTAPNDERALRERGRDLNLRRIALQVEAEILAQAPPQLSSRQLNPQWLQRWRTLAPAVYGDALRRLWARALVAEVAQPGRLQQAVLDLLAHLGEDDVRCIELLAGYSFGAFLFDARDRYFRRELHGHWLHIAVELGLLQAGAGRLHLHGAGEPLLLVCGRRALQVAGLGAAGLQLPVLRVTGLGRQVFSVCRGESDLAYLLDVAAWLRATGASVALGDWRARDGHFLKRLDIP